MLPRLPYEGAVDADGHVLEPPDLWEKYLEPKYRDRALRVCVGDDGYEYLEIDGKRAKLTRPGALGMMGGMGMGMMNPMMGMSNVGSLSSMAGSYFDPRASAMNSSDTRSEPGDRRRPEKPALSLTTSDLSLYSVSTRTWTSLPTCFPSLEYTSAPRWKSSACHAGGSSPIVEA